MIKLKEILLSETADRRAMRDSEDGASKTFVRDFKKTFEKSEWKKNRKISSLIKKMIDLEAKLGNEVAELE